MTQVADAPVAFTEAPDDEGTTDKRKLALIGVGAAVVLAVLGYLLLGGGGGSNDQAAVVPSAHHLLKPATSTTGKTPAKAVVLPPASTAKLGRDPFRPQYTVPVVAPVGTTTGTTGTTGSTGTTGTGSTGTSTGTTGTTKPPAPVATTYALRLVRIDGTGSNLTAKFAIGSTGKFQFARAGSVFGRTAEIRLLSMQRGTNGAGTAVIQVGDASPFDMSTADAAIYVQ